MAFFNITRFHLLVMLYWQFSMYMISQMLFPIFGIYVPKWRCMSGMSNQTYAKDCKLFAECNGNVEFENNFFQSAALEFDWTCGQAAHFTTVYIQIQFVGIILGTLVFGSFADAFGRKPAAIVDLLVAMSSSLIGGFAPNWQVLFASRFLIGFSVGGAVVAMTLCMELVLPEQRVPMRGLFNWGIARLCLTMSCFFFPEWRQSTLVFAPVCLCMLLIVILVLPESPTWLHNKGRIQKMHETEKYIAKVGKIEYVKSEVKEVDKSGTIIDLLKNPVLFKRLAVLWFMYFTSAISSYGNDFNSTTISGNLYLNQALFSIFIAASKLVLIYVDTKFPNFSRRNLHQGSQLLVCSCFFTLMFLNEHSVWILIVNLIGTIFIEYTWDAEGLAVVESMPTKLRSSAIGSCSLVARFGAILAPVLGYLNLYWPLSIYTIITVVGLVNLFVSYMWLVETKGVTLDNVELDDKLLEEEVHMATHHETSDLLNKAEKKKSIS
ncbi:hypothetical protein M3Y97_00638500 [Aphelenchoides bicaudatus]|nr:hypothetical protein M3Y97_00638500 [Aphelenchoides bicaudatus]